MATKAKDAAQDGAQATKDTAAETGEQGTDAADQTDGFVAQLKETAAEAALAVLKPAIRAAAEGAAGFLVTRGPELVKDKLDEASGLDEMVKGLSSGGPAAKLGSTLGTAGNRAQEALEAGAGEEEPEAEEEEEPEAEEEEEPEAEEKPKRKPAARRRKAQSSDRDRQSARRRQPSRSSAQRSKTSGGGRSSQRSRKPQRRTAKSSSR